MATNRRQFLQWSGASLAATQLNACARNNKEVRLYGGYRDYGNNYGAACINQNAELIWKLQTPARAHEVCLQHDLSLGAVVARRPGDFIQLFDPQTGQALEQIIAPANLIFEGHGLFRTSSSGKKQLWATASLKASSESRLLRYDLDNLTQLPEQFAIAGLGPHQMLQPNSLQATDQIVIAIGGWRSEGRTVLNADSFESGLVFFQPETGTHTFVAVPNPRLSARHMATHGSDLWVAMQLADPAPTEDVLLYRYSGDAWHPATAPEQSWRGFNGYLGSLSIAAGEVVATSPQGHRFGRWSLQGEPISTTDSLDISAATSIEDQWWISSGVGEVQTASMTMQSKIFWDNHWVGHSV
jgi:uncharacterized protein